MTKGARFASSHSFPKSISNCAAEQPRNAAPRPVGTRKNTSQNTTPRRCTSSEIASKLSAFHERIAPVDGRGAAMLAGERAGTRDFPDQQQRGLVIIEFPVHSFAPSHDAANG